MWTVWTPPIHWWIGGGLVTKGQKRTYVCGILFQVIKHVTMSGLCVYKLTSMYVSIKKCVTGKMCTLHKALPRGHHCDNVHA